MESISHATVYGSVYRSRAISNHVYMNICDTVWKHTLPVLIVHGENHGTNRGPRFRAGSFELKTFALMVRKTSCDRSRHNSLRLEPHTKKKNNNSTTNNDRRPPFPENRLYRKAIRNKPLNAPCQSPESSLGRPYSTGAARSCQNIGTTKFHRTQDLGLV